MYVMEQGPVCPGSCTFKHKCVTCRSFGHKACDCADTTDTSEYKAGIRPNYHYSRDLLALDGHRGSPTVAMSMWSSPHTVFTPLHHSAWACI